MGKSNNIQNDYIQNIGILKTRIRKSVLAIREQLPAKERERAEVLMTERILSHQFFYGSAIILGFAGYGSEINTMEILKEALRCGKKVYLPRVEGNNMTFYRIFSLEDLYPGYKGIPEPVGTTEIYFYTGNAADIMMLMPGVAFDRRRNRIGYGKGFYDRFLADKKELQLRTVAIGFQCQMVEEIPTQENDIRPCQIICY